MKVLSIISAGYEQGGAETAVTIYTKNLRELGHESKIISSDVRPELPHFSDYEFKAVPAKGLKNFLYAIFNPSAFKVTKRVLREFQPDVVILNTMQQVTPSVLFLLKKYPSIQFVHGPEAFTVSLLPWHMDKASFKNNDYDTTSLTLVGRFKYLYLRVVLGAMYRLGFRNVNRFIVLSDHMRKLLQRDGIKRPITRIICGIVSPGQIEVIRPAPPLIGYAGRLETYKGVEDLLDAMALILQKQSDAKLVFIGEGGYTQQMRGRAESLGIAKSVVFKGHVDQPTLYKLYSEMSVFVMPSRLPEAFGKVGIEAMSMGTPVIATDVGGISEWLCHGKNGLLVPPSNPAALADSILQIIQNSERRILMSKQSRKTSKAFSNEAYIQDMLNVINETVGY